MRAVKSIVARRRLSFSPAPAFALACAVSIAGLVTGCAASEIEPRSAATIEGDAWDPFAPDLAKLAPRSMRDPGARVADRSAPTSLTPGETMTSPPPFEADPAPIRARPRSISLGYVGDEPLTPSGPTAPRWPWVQEPFHHDRGSYGGRVVYGRRW